MWFFFALTSAIIYSLRGVFEKTIVNNVNKYILGFAIRFFALPFFLLPFIFLPQTIIPIHELSQEFWIALAVVCLINTPLETIFYYEALKEEEVSLVIPILSLSPALTLFLGTFLLHEYPTFYGILGIFLILAGIYSLKISQAKEGLLQPFHHLKNSRGVRLMLIVAVSYGFGSIFDKIGVAQSNAYVYAFANYTFISLVLFVIAYWKARNDLKQIWLYKKQFSMIGVIVAAYTLLYMLSLQDGFASYAIAIRNASIIFTILLGYIFFREKHIKQKLLAALIIFIGLLCIKILG